MQILERESVKKMDFYEKSSRDAIIYGYHKRIRIKAPRNNIV